MLTQMTEMNLSRPSSCRAPGSRLTVTLESKVSPELLGQVGLAGADRRAAGWAYF